MALVSFTIDPAAGSYTDDQIVAKINSATAQITRAGSVAAAARPLVDGEVASAKLAAGVAKANLDAMSDTTRAYIKTSPTSGQFPVVSIERQADGKYKIDSDNVAV